MTPFPVSEPLLCYFATYLGCSHLAPQTIKVYLAAIRHMQITLGLPEPRQLSSMPRLRLVQSGIQRLHAHNSSPKIRLPITPAILQRLKRYWSPKCSDPDTIMLWAAAVTCFFGFFRAGEICIPTLSSFDKERHLAWGDVSLNNRSDPTCMKVHLKYSKTDQLGQGVDIFIGKTGCALCPIQATIAYMAVRGSSEGPYFRLSCGHPLTKPYFTSHIREALQAIGLPESQFAGHSFRIGAATTAASAGLEDSTIRTLGRWNSSAFLLYIRTPREQLAMLSRALLAPQTDYQN